MTTAISDPVRNRIRRTDLLVSAPFIASLALLALNDWVLKNAWHNEFTGKLSDFAGVALFSLFWIAFFPTRMRTVLIATALGFAWWKSPLSQAFIEYWNAWMPLRIARVADYGDLAALIVLPIVVVYVRRPPMARVIRWLRMPLAACALATMMGTAALKPDTPENRAYRRVLDERVTQYTWGSSLINEKDMRRLTALLSTLPDKAAVTPSTLYRTEHRGDSTINAQYELPEYFISAWFYPNPGRTGEFAFSPHHDCAQALAEGAPVTNPVKGARIEFRSIPAGARVSGVELTLCDLPHKRSSSEALRYFFDTVLPPIETALQPHKRMGVRPTIGGDVNALLPKETGPDTICQADAHCWCRKFTGAEFKEGREQSSCKDGRCAKCLYE